jgi:two-component system sensor histidine kinase KdpD
MRADLLRSVSHDIRTPLTSIIGSTSAVLDNPGLSPQEQRELLEGVRSEAQWLIRVVENLLSITRIGADQAQITKQMEAAEEVLGEVAQKFRRRFPNIAITVSAPEELLLVPMDPILIRQVLSNLLENAAIHGKTTTQVYLELRQEEVFACFSVRDNGCGIPEKELPTLFDGALKHHDTIRGDEKRNMGLGLSVCLAIVRAHGGAMEAHNLDTGAEFLFRLPLKEGETA